MQGTYTKGPQIYLQISRCVRRVLRVIRKRGLIRSSDRATVRTRRLAIYPTKQVRACNKFTATFIKKHKVLL